MTPRIRFGLHAKIRPERRLPPPRGATGIDPGLRRNWKVRIVGQAIAVTRYQFGTLGEVSDWAIKQIHSRYVNEDAIAAARTLPDPLRDRATGKRQEIR